MRRPDKPNKPYKPNKPNKRYKPRPTKKAFPAVDLLTQLDNFEYQKEQKIYRMAGQRYGNIPPLLSNPTDYYGTAGGGTAGASAHSNTQPATYFETKAEKDDFRMSRQRFGNYPPLHPYPSNHYNPASEGTSETSGSSHKN